MSIESEISTCLKLDKILGGFADAKGGKISFSQQVHFCIVEYNRLKQGCGAGTQISGSGSGFSSRHLKFFAPVPKIFGSGSKMVWSIEN